MSDARQLADYYRPTKLDQMLGQDAAIQQVTGMLARKAMPNTLLLHGNTGCGKTSLARIIGRAITYPQKAIADNPDYHEYDMGGDRGIDNSRNIIAAAQYKPRSQYNVIAIDEIAKATTQAFSPLLKTLEEPPKQSIFILITDEPERLPKTILNRCYKIGLEPFTPPDLKRLLLRVAKKEAIELPKKVLTYIANHAIEPRSALTMLQQARDAGNSDYKAVLQVLKASPDGLEKQAINLLAALYNKKYNAVFNILLQDCNSIAMATKLLTYNRWIIEQVSNNSKWSDGYTELFKKAVAEPPSLNKLMYTHNVLCNLRRDLPLVSEFEQRHLVLARLGTHCFNI